MQTNSNIKDKVHGRKKREDECAEDTEQPHKALYNFRFRRLSLLYYVQNVLPIIKFIQERCKENLANLKNVPSNKKLPTNCN
ncbi:hypothetical protein OC25_10680 [Pedobacter kyungheensis]|uniref:Uncharacterized protein n=1 Tax=Pedobacter kyungheensis TaxID=1069985 RepID=A0A0C1FMA5_9SPHI|nr:hypothetical protein OC25_10680 [Pedobacter kyungheensis]